MNKRATRGYWTMELPVISTGHLTEEVAEALSKVLPGEDFYGYYCAVTGHGGFVHFGDLEADERGNLPACLRDVAEWAEREEFEWVRFDSDGDRIEGLPYYEW